MDSGHRAKQTKKLEVNGCQGRMLASMGRFCHQQEDSAINERTVIHERTLMFLGGLCNPQVNFVIQERTLIPKEDSVKTDSSQSRRCAPHK